jgi:hypothetical protein
VREGGVVRAGHSLAQAGRAPWQGLVHAVFMVSLA